MMKYALAAAAVAATALSAPVLATDVGVSVSIGQPGFYGRLDIGGFPSPPVIYRRSILVEPVPLVSAPIYLRVPPGHAKHWHKHCHEYRACGERVYFVQEDWYNREYVPRYRESHPHRESYGRDGDWEQPRGEGQHEGRGHGHGRGHGRGHDD